MDPLVILVGVAVVAVGLLFTLLGFVGLAAKVISELPRTRTDGIGPMTNLDVNYGAVLKAILKAMADAPGYVLALAVGLTLIYLGLRTLGIDLPGTPQPTPSPSPTPGGSPATSPVAS